VTADPPDTPMRWHITLHDGATVRVETRDNPPFENALGTTTHNLAYRGATAVIVSCGTLEPDVREQSCAHHIAGAPTREMLHEQAVMWLASANGWRGARIEEE